ncbi:DEAD box protein 52 homolog [Anopheles ziemanni]|uniref:DEAD box protein 52 homolog n=1 Tax=Anopheles coustani TaxID=139045 RepID=UPI00265AF811|nr:DEAD box protein 52 homolog [Anopheles coustani]XP_058175842.1 DEAD box protein 52 homolog [Anopheles ziemanni]
MIKTNDIFRKLTCGAKFSNKNRPPPKRKLEVTPEVVPPPLSNIKVRIKQEKLDPDESTYHETPTNTSELEDVDIKSEASESENVDIKSEIPTPVLDKPKKKKIKEMSPEKFERVMRARLNRIRNIHKITIKKSANCSEAPNPIETFDELATRFSCSNQLVSNVKACYSKPTPVQMQAIPTLLEGLSLHACAPTGSGKTAAFLIPILHHLKEHLKCGFRALIICPTRELAKQTQREALRLGDELNIRTHVIGTVDDRWKCDYSFSGGRNYDILVTTPNRICYLLAQNPPRIDLSNIQWIVVDEADKLFEDSKNSFREQLDTVLSACNNPSKTLALFSATQTGDVNKWVAQNIPDRVRFCIGMMNGAVDLVEQQLLFTGTEGGKLLAFRDMVAQGLNPPVLVFVQSKDRAQQLFTELLYDGLNVDVIHADRSQQERDNVVRAFREGKIWILICTELMSRGIDFKGVNLVINYDFPPSTISYVHRVGRTGRAGRPGKAVTYFTKDDTTNLKAIAMLIKQAGGDVPEYMLKLNHGSQRKREELARKAPKRATIRTLPAFELQKLQRNKKFVAHTKGKRNMHRKYGDQHRENSE